MAAERAGGAGFFLNEAESFGTFKKDIAGYGRLPEAVGKTRSGTVGTSQQARQQVMAEPDAVSRSPPQTLNGDRPGTAPFGAEC